MTKRIIVVCIIFIFISKISAQDSMSNKFGLGYHILEHQNDFGFGLNITSPYFYKKMVAFRLKTSVMSTVTEINNKEETVFYSNTSLGMAGIGGYINNKIRVYGELGLMAILPSTKFSSEKIVPGTYGLFGFDFFVKKRLNYYIEIGNVSILKVKDKLPNQTIYSNGMSISAGMRIFLK